MDPNPIQTPFLIEFLNNAWDVLAEMAPWLLLGAGTAGLLHVFLPRDFIHRHLGRGRFSNVVKAVLFGVPMPLCSCGVIPAALGLKKDGASDGASVGFLISTPQTGIDSIFVSASFLGWPFAIFKVVSAFITGLLGGLAVNITGPPEADHALAAAPPPRADSGTHRSRLHLFTDFVFGELIYTIWKLLVVGILISAAITTIVPAGTLAGSPYVDGLLGKLIVLVFSLGLYVCATGSVPIAASLVAAGMPVGSALVFLMAGPATNVATMGAVLRTFGRRVLVIYLLVLSAGSVLLGQAFDMMIGGQARELVMTHHHEPSAITTLFGWAFLALLAWYAFSDLKNAIVKRKNRRTAGLETREFAVEGMTCQACARKVTYALNAGEGVSNVAVDLESGMVKVAGRELKEDSLIAAVQGKGYKIKAVE